MSMLSRIRKRRTAFFEIFRPAGHIGRLHPCSIRKLVFDSTKSCRGRTFAMNAPAAENPGKSIADRLVYWLVVSVQRDGKRKTTAENINLCDIFTVAGFNRMLIGHLSCCLLNCE
ncbi:hypothetical protein [Burkholderia gladioli]|uniref:hypothetical protein n=1 Tax=Burkholderia gladioli TaxID=28095 RepID=UPI0034DAF446